MVIPLVIEMLKWSYDATIASDYHRNYTVLLKEVQVL